MTHAFTFDLLYFEMSRFLINIHDAQLVFIHAFVIQLKEESLLFQMLNYLYVLTALKSIFAVIKELSNIAQPKTHLNFF